MKKCLSDVGWWLSGMLWISGILLLLTDSAWIGDVNVIIPWVNLGDTIALLIGLPVSLALLIFPKSRQWGGLIIYVLSWPCWFWLWLVALVYAGNVSSFWAAIGVILGGVGVIPIAAIMMLLQQDWVNLFALVGTLICTIALRWTGSRIMARAAEHALLDRLRAERQRSLPAVS